MNANQESNQEKIRARLEIFNRKLTQKINDESIDIDKYAVIEKITEWVEVQFSLFDILCKLILGNLSLFTKGKEQYYIDEIIREKIVIDWENGSAATHLKRIQQSILDDERNQELLKLYVKILKTQERGGTIDNNQDRRKLLEVGIIREEKDGRVKVANPIYESVFNREWVYQNLPALHQVTSNQRVNNKDRAIKQSKLFSQSILIAFLVIAVAYPISRLSNETKQLTSSQSSPIAIPSPQTSPTGIQNPECFTRNAKNEIPDASVLAQDASLALDRELSSKNIDSSSLKEFQQRQFTFAQLDCKVVVTIYLGQNQTFEKKHEEKLIEVIKNGVNPDAINKIKLEFRIFNSSPNLTKE